MVFVSMMARCVGVLRPPRQQKQSTVCAFFCAVAMAGSSGCPSLPALADQLNINESGSGASCAQLGTGEQKYFEQRGTNNRQINVDTIGHYHEAPQQEAAPLPTHTLPFPRDDGFVERPELAQLEGKLSRSEIRVALYGLGGIG